MNPRSHTTIHHSLRFDRSDRVTEKALAGHRAAADTLPVTEIKGRRELLHVPGWRYAAANDVAYTWDTAVWRLIARDVETIRRTWALGKSRHEDAFGLPLVVLEDRETRHRLAAGVMHMPAGVQSDYTPGLRGAAPRSARALSHLWLAAHARRRIRRLGRRHRVDAVQLCADTNLSWHSGWVRAWFRANYLRWTCCWAARPTRDGTHAGGRLIDWIWMLGARFQSAEVLPPDPASDHRAIKVRWRFTNKTPRHQRKIKP